MSKGDREERRKRQAEKANKPEGPTIRHYRQPFGIPVKTLSQIRGLAGQQLSEPNTEQQYAGIQTDLDILRLIHAIKKGHLKVAKEPFFSLELLAIVLRLTGQELTAKEVRDKEEKGTVH